MAILGGGWLGREVAGAARAAGHPRLGGHVHVVVAGMHVNDWDATKPIRAVVAAGSVDVRRLRVPRVPLGEMVGG